MSEGNSRHHKIINETKEVEYRLARSHLGSFYLQTVAKFCFYCGILGHSHKDCEFWEVARERFKAEGLPYGN